MNRLLSELDRLYGLGSTALAKPAAGAGDARPGVRAAVLAVVLPAGWDALSAVWRGVQSDLDLPAPAIAVSGFDALQLWFSFASPISPFGAARFLQGLRARYLPGLKPSQLRMLVEPAELPPAPCAEMGPQRWSAFVTHDLAAVFADTPWLDIPPTDEGQAALLRAHASIRPAGFDAALDKFGAAGDGGPAVPVASVPTAEPGGQPAADPARFLTSVMNDGAAPLALRIEAARILLSCGQRA